MFYIFEIDRVAGSGQRQSRRLSRPGPEGEGAPVDAADVVGPDRLGDGHAERQEHAHSGTQSPVRPLRRRLLATRPPVPTSRVSLSYGLGR